MLKFFRKYNKIILVVGGSFLMVVFLLPQALTQMGSNPLSRTVGTINGRKVSFSEIRDAQREFSIAYQVVPEVFDVLIQPDSAEHWYLLRGAINEAGLVGGPQDGALLRSYAVDLITDLQYGTANISPQFRQSFADQVRTRVEARYDLAIRSNPPQIVNQALAQVMGIIRMYELYESTDLISRSKSIEAARRIFDTVTVAVGIIPPSSVYDRLPEVTEERIEAKFEEFKEIRSIDDELGIGYLRPPAVQLEWLAIPRQAISDAIQLDNVEVIKFWRQARERNPGIYPADFSAAQESVETAFRREEANRVLDKVDEIIRRELLIARRGIAREAGMLVLPDDWADRRPSLESIGNTVSQELATLFAIEGIQIPVRTTGGQFRTQSELSLLEGIGSARVQLNAQNALPVSQFALGARDLNPESTLEIQSGLIYGPAQLGGFGDRYYFRITAIRPESAPDSIDEVREKMIEDIRLEDALEYFSENLDSYRDRFSLEQPDWFQEPESVEWEFLSVDVTGQRVMRANTGVLYPALDTPEFRDAVLDIVREWDPKLSAGDFKPTQKTLAMVSPEARGLVIAQVRVRKPPTIEQYRAGGVAIERQVLGEFLEYREDAPFSWDRMKERANFEFVGRVDGDEDGDGIPDIEQEEGSTSADGSDSSS